MQIKQLFKYALFFVLLILLFHTQVFIFKQKGIDAYPNKIVLIYIINSILVIILLVFIDLFKNKLKDQIGFIFMSGSLLKFVFFFVFIYPYFMNDGKLSRIEFVTFFIPYSYCLLFEAVVISRLLNKMKFKKS